MAVRTRGVDGGVAIDVRVAPSSSADRILGIHDEALKLAVTAPPEKGKANRAVVRLLSERLGLGRGALAIVAGEHDRRKTVRIEGWTEEEAARRLERLLASAEGGSA